MYIPHQFAISEWEEITNFARSVRAADIVTVNDEGTPIATLMPFIWEESGDPDSGYGKLVMHMAKANAQWKLARANSQALAIIRGAQAYISPTNYERKLVDHKVVPTWNYQSLHLSGKIEVSEDIEVLRSIVTQLSTHHEASRENPWDPADIDPQYLELELKGIVAITLHITKVEAKYKLSQNKSAQDQARIIDDLTSTGISGEAEIAEQMRRLQP